MQVPGTEVIEDTPTQEEQKYKQEEVYEAKSKDIPESSESLYFENLAEKIKDKELDRIAKEVLDGFEQDEASISELKDMREQYNKLHDLVHEQKNTPFEKASSVKLPILTKACIQFASRSGINSETGGEIAKIDPVSSDEDSFYRSKKVATHFNHQLKYGTPNHYQSHRKTRMQLARDGYAFRKVYWDSIKKKVISTHILPEDFIVNYHSRDLSECYRYTHVLRPNDNEVKIKMAQGIYKDQELSPISVQEVDAETSSSKENIGQSLPQEIDFTSVRDVLEMHTYILLKESDDIRIPVVVTLDKESKKIFRIIKRSHPETGEALKYFINYTFIPNDKSIYGYGFGQLLYPLVLSMNTAVNQLINAGTLATNGTGFIAKGSGLPRGTHKMKMGELSEINNKGEDISKSVLQLKFAPPAPVLLHMIEFLGVQVDSLSTVTELMTGGQPRSDTTATAASIAQTEAVKLFTDIQKAYHISLGEEFQCMKMMYSIFLDESSLVDYSGVEPFQITRDDYSSKLTIMPVADPNVVNKQEAIGKAEAILNLIKQDPFLQQDPEALLLGTTNLLESMGVNPKKIEEIKAIYDHSIKSVREQQIVTQHQSLQIQLAEEQQKNLDEASKEVEKKEKQMGGEQQSQ